MRVGQSATVKYSCQLAKSCLSLLLFCFEAFPYAVRPHKKQTREEKANYVLVCADCLLVSEGLNKAEPQEVKEKKLFSIMRERFCTCQEMHWQVRRNRSQMAVSSVRLEL
jgi:hypothetical protein